MTSPTVAMYRREWITGFQQTNHYLRAMTSSQAEREGGSFVWTVSSPDSSRMSSRGVDGAIPASPGTDTQVTGAAVEAVAKEIKTNFDVFKATASQRDAMLKRRRAQVMREFDGKILDELANATTTFGSTGAITYARINDIASDLLEAVKEPMEVNFLWTAKAWGRINQMTEFTSADYLPGYHLASGEYARVVKWAHGTHTFHPGLPGAGTASATCFAFVKPAIGHAYEASGENLSVGYNEEDHYHYCSASVIHSAKILQDSGIIKYTHDDTTAF